MHDDVGDVGCTLARANGAPSVEARGRKRGNTALFSVTMPLDGAETLGAAMRDEIGDETGIKIEHIVAGPMQR